jgi:hypothetical protein
MALRTLGDRGLTRGRSKCMKKKDGEKECGMDRLRMLREEECAIDEEIGVL